MRHVARYFDHKFNAIVRYSPTYKNLYLIYYKNILNNLQFYSKLFLFTSSSSLELPTDNK